MAVQAGNQTYTCIFCSRIMIHYDELLVHVDAHLAKQEEDRLEQQYNSQYFNEEYDCCYDDEDGDSHMTHNHNYHHIDDKDNCKQKQKEVIKTSENVEDFLVDANGYLVKISNKKSKNPSNNSKNNRRNKLLTEHLDDEFETVSSSQCGGAIIVLSSSIRGDRRNGIIRQLESDGFQILFRATMTFSEITDKTDIGKMGMALDLNATLYILLLGHEDGYTIYSKLNKLYKSYSKSKFAKFMHFTLTFKDYYAKLNELLPGQHHRKWWANLKCKYPKYVEQMPLFNQLSMDAFHDKEIEKLQKEKLRKHVKCCCLMSYQKAIRRSGVLRISGAKYVPLDDVILSTLFAYLNPFDGGSEKEEDMELEWVCEKCC